ncbi:MAG TPA: hypothetical protein VMD78_14195 [Candidatus Baltobacteraceae bacterium]|nr:hypothetical protein [Candidatus Baltobacteraceae bacterium]
MKRLAGLLVLLMLVVVPARAQDTQSQDNPPSQENTPPQSTSSSSSSSASQTNTEETEQPKKKVSTLFRPKYEISVGYDHRSFYLTGQPKIGMNGWVASFDYDWKSWLGFEGEGQGVYKTITNVGAATQYPSLYTIMGGPQIFPFRHHKVSPFGHFLYGEGYFRLPSAAYGTFGPGFQSSFSHSLEGGGGLDVKFKDNWAIRGMFDYGTTRFFGATGQGGYRISIGLVYYLGRK